MSMPMVFRRLVLAAASAAAAVALGCGDDPPVAPPDDPSDGEGPARSAVAPPRAVLAVGAGTDAIRLTWEPNPEATGARVYWAPRGDPTPAGGRPLDPAPPGAATLEHAGLERNTPYHYIVASLDSAGVGPASPTLVAQLGPELQVTEIGPPTAAITDTALVLTVQVVADLFIAAYLEVSVGGRRFEFDDPLDPERLRWVDTIPVGWLPPGPHAFVVTVTDAKGNRAIGTRVYEVGQASAASRYASTSSTE